MAKFLLGPYTLSSTGLALKADLSFIVIDHRELSIVDGLLHVGQALLPVVALVVHAELGPEIKCQASILHHQKPGSVAELVSQFCYPHGGTA